MKSHILRGIVFLLVAFLGFSLAIMLLWNALLPDLLQLPAISLPQAMGLLVLARLLFGGIGCGHKHMGHPGHGKRFREKHAAIEKWLQMTPAEQAEFRRSMRAVGKPTEGGDNEQA